jgi:hypothetical protein
MSVAVAETSYTAEELAAFQRLKDDLPFYAEKCLKIRTKAGGVRPFILNRVQRHIHERLERQLAETGKIRALILKGRQEGCSTYVEGRFYHKTTWSRGVRAFILTHEQDATDNIYQMAQRFHEHCPPEVRPSTGTSNAKELRFDKLDSGYRVAQTSANDSGGAGRSQTNQLFHGSEVAMWKNADDQAAGALQTVPDELGTEIILESTARGFGNFFHRMWSEAERELSDFIAIFIPWFWEPGYRVDPPPDFSLTEEESAYMEAHGLDLQQMAWRRDKIRVLGDPLLFCQEYPATAAEAFQTTGHDSFIKPAVVLKARRTKLQAIGELVLGVDPARGGDRFSIARRRGRVVSKVESRKIGSITDGAGWVKQVIDSEKPKRVFVDAGGLGAGVYDLLRDWGYGNVVRAVDFGGKPIEPPKLDDKGEEIGGCPFNRRAEMWLASRDWLEHPGGASIPDRDTLQQDATAPGYKWRESGGVTRLVLESKEDIRKRGAPSPDEWDSVALTFAEPVITTDWGKPLDYSKSNFMVADTLESLGRLRQQRESRIV